jgi:hypothetical protein
MTRPALVRLAAGMGAFLLVDLWPNAIRSGTTTTYPASSADGIRTGQTTGPPSNFHRVAR